MAVKGEKGSPVSAVNHCQCADMFSLQMISVHICGAVFAFTNCIFIIQGSLGPPGGLGPRGPAGPQGSKGDKVAAYIYIYSE